MRIKTKEDGILDVQCQQYFSGLYVCLYRDGRMFDQFGLGATTRKQFLQDLKDNKDVEILDS